MPENLRRNNNTKVFSWDITQLCNYNCEYCFFSSQTRLGPPVSELEKIVRSWEIIHRKYGIKKLFITGGEPFCYENFIEVILALSDMFDLHITTNLSCSLDTFVSRADPRKVQLNASFHPKRIDLSSFSNKVIFLKNSGFTCGITYLAHPSQLREMQNYKEYFQSKGLDMAIEVFVGDYKGKKYPAGYTQKQLRFYKQVLVYPYSNISDSCIESHAVLHKQCENLELKDQKTKPCAAGKDYASVDVNGNVRRCGQSDKELLGNIFKHDLKLLDHNKLCSEKYCKSRKNELYS